MKLPALLVVLSFVIALLSGCSTTTQEEKEAYFQGGGMDEQVQSWKTKPGGRY